MKFYFLKKNHEIVQVRVHKRDFNSALSQTITKRGDADPSVGVKENDGSFADNLKRS